MRKIPFAGIELTSQRVRGLRGCYKVRWHYYRVLLLRDLFDYILVVQRFVLFLKKNQNAPRPSEHPPSLGEKMSKRLGGINVLFCLSLHGD